MTVLNETVEWLCAKVEDLTGPPLLGGSGMFVLEFGASPTAEGDERRMRNSLVQKASLFLTTVDSSNGHSIQSSW